MEFIYSMIIQVGLYIILASSFDLIIGYGGLISIAHPIFVALGAYTSGLISMHLGLPIVISILIGALVAALTSLGLALPSLRVSGDYLMIASIGFQLGVLQIIKNVDFTGGHTGLIDIPSLLEGPDRSKYYLVLVYAVAVVVLWFKWLVTKGDYGRAIKAMKDDEVAFVALGRNSMAIKITLFALGCGIGGLAGGMYAHYFLYLTPEQFEIIESAALLTMCVVGGMATHWGPVIGALLIVALPQTIQFLDLPPSVNAPLQGLLYTTLVMIFLFARPQGLLGGERSLTVRRTPGGEAARPATVKEGTSDA
ncbi:MAG: branched-chain amino acid ABC transporter permease [Thermodesulfobacteriota bacterium]